jgi:wobble nucleotide-excising tRNase
MFRRIESISNAAVWSHYDGRNSGTPDFQRYNLIYGWNASGKTTLSRVLGLFAPASSTRLPADARVRVTVGEDLLDSSRDRGRVGVHIFNRDFVDDNLQKDGHTHAPALFIVGQDNIRLTSRIASLAKRREKVATMYRTLQKTHADANGAREKAATDLARECGQILGIRDFRAPNLKGIAEKLGNPTEQLLGGAALQACVTQARDQSAFAPFRAWPKMESSKPPAFDQIAQLLRETPQQSAIKRLSDDRALSDWVRSGLRFHEGTSACAFCGGNAADALAAYLKHFSDEYRKQHAAVSAVAENLEQPMALPTFPHENDWVPSVRSKAQEALHRLEAWATQEGEIRSGWARLLREKLANMDTVLSVEPICGGSPALAEILVGLQQAKDDHDRACDQLAATRLEAAEQVKAHFAAKYCLDPVAAEATAALRNVGADLARVQEVGQKIKGKLDIVQAELQRSSVAATQINSLLTRILGSRIAVEQASDKRIQFIREGQPATNMSDGERTAISLAYFLVSLGQNGRRLEDQIVFIDDPICSLDANHIYDVAFLLLSNLKPCLQLFVSTHNSEFFNTVKQEWSHRGGFKKEHVAFLVHREGNGASQLSGLPAHLAKFRSDYHHVFYCLRRFHTSNSADVDAYMSCPNLLRRFLEMYLGFRKPTSSSYLTKLDVLFDDEVERGAVAKYADEGSHSTSTLRLLEYSDFPALSREMVGRVMRAVERADPEHYSVLMAETA